MDFSAFKWINEGPCKTTERGIELYAPAETDYFVNPADGVCKANAPFFYMEAEGDFVFRARVSHDFLYTYDACVLFALDDLTHWAKACFEFTDFGTYSVVTVMTNGLSDDSNNAQVDGKEVWLQLARKGNVFGVHYSLDGKMFNMARLCRLPMRDKIKVGLVAQSPTGQGGARQFEDVSLELKSLEDIRNGNK